MRGRQFSLLLPVVGRVQGEGVQGWKLGEGGGGTNSALAFVHTSLSLE